MLPPVAIASAAPASADSVAAMDASSAPARLDRLIAARDLDEGGLRALAARDPELVWQLVDPRKRAALEFILSMPPAEIRRIRDGQMVVPKLSGGPEEVALFRELGVRSPQVRALHVRTRDAQLVRIELDVRREVVMVDLAWPAGMARTEAVGAIERWLGHPLATTAPARLVDPSFEDPEALGVAWTIGKGGARLDGARRVDGRTSLRVEDGYVTQAFPVSPGDQVFLSVQVAAEAGASASAGLLGTEAKTNHGATIDAAWHAYTTRLYIPDGVTSATIRLDVEEGAANFDDIRLIVGDPESFVASWPRATYGSILVRGDPVAVPEAADAAAGIDRAVRAGLSRIAVNPTGTVTVTLYGDSPPAVWPRRGTCGSIPSTANACALRVLVERAWGAPGNAFVADGLCMALSGNGADYGHLPDMANEAPLAQQASAYPSRPASQDAAASFALWLLQTQGNAAVRAAWQAKTLEGFTVAGMDLAAMDRAWRQSVGR